MMQIETFTQAVQKLDRGMRLIFCDVVGTVPSIYAIRELDDTTALAQYRTALTQVPSMEHESLVQGLWSSHSAVALHPAAPPVPVPPLPPLLLVNMVSPSPHPQIAKSNAHESF